MGQNQVKKQKKYGEFDVKLDQLQLGFEQERKNNFAMERSTHPQQPLSKSEQPRPLAASRFQMTESKNQKRSISSEKAYMALKFQQDKKKQRNDDPILKKMKEINKCQNVADFFLNGIQLQNVNCSLINTIQMNYNIIACQQRQEDATCTTKKAETSQFVVYLQNKVLTEVDRVEKIDFEELKHISVNYQAVDQENLNDSYQFDIYSQEKSKFQAVTKIERNKQKKQSEISQIISSKKNDNSVYMQPYDQTSIQKSKYQSNLQQNRKQSTFNEFEEVYLELLSDKYQNDKNYDNQDAISTNSNKIKLSQMVKNNNNIHSDQVSSNSSLIREKKNPQNYNFKSELGQQFKQPINIYEMPVYEQQGDLDQEIVKKSPPSNIKSKITFNPLVKQESTPLNAYPDEYTKYPKEQTNSNLFNNQNNPQNKNYNISQYNGLINNSDKIIKDESVHRVVNQLQFNSQNPGQFNQSPLSTYENKQSKQVQDNANNYSNLQKNNQNLNQYKGLADNSDKINKDDSEFRIPHQFQNGSQLTEQNFSDPSNMQNNPQNKNYNISQYKGLVNNSEKIINDGSIPRIVNQLQFNSQQPEQFNQSAINPPQSQHQQLIQGTDSFNYNNPQNNKNYNISQYNGLINNSEKIIKDGSVHRIVHQLQNGSSQLQSNTANFNNIANSQIIDNQQVSGLNSQIKTNPQNQNYNISQYNGLINNSDNIIKDNSVNRIVNHLQNGLQNDSQNQFNPNNNNFDVQASLRPASNNLTSNPNISNGQSQFQIRSNQGPNSFIKKQESGDIQDFQANLNQKVPENIVSANNLTQERKNPVTYMNIRDNNLESQASISNKGQHINSQVNGMESLQIQSFQPIQNTTNLKQIRDLKQSNQSNQDIDNLISINQQQKQQQAEFQSNQNSNQSSNFINDQRKIPIKNVQQITQTQPLAQNLDFETESIPKKITKSQNNPVGADKMLQNNHRDNKKVLNPNLDFEEPLLNQNKKNKAEVDLLKSSQASENFSSNFINEKGAQQKILIEDSRKNETHSNQQQLEVNNQIPQPIQKNVQQNLPQININYYQGDSHKSSTHSDRNQINGNNFSTNKANNNFNNNSNTQTQYITPQKTQYSSTYIDSTNIIKNMKEPYAQNIDSQDTKQNKNQIPMNGNQHHLSYTQQPTQFQSNFAKQEPVQRSRASSTQNLDQQQNIFSSNIRLKDQVDPNYNSQAINQRSRVNSNHTQDSQFQYHNNFNQLASNGGPQSNTYQTNPNAYSVNNKQDSFNKFDNKNLNSAPNLIKGQNNQALINNQNQINSNQQFNPISNQTQKINQNEDYTINNQNGIRDPGQFNHPNINNAKTDQQKDQGQRKIIQLGGKTYNQPSNQNSQQKNYQMMESPYRSSDEKSNHQSKSSISKTQINQNKYFAPNLEKTSPSRVKYAQTNTPIQNVIYYLSEDQQQPNNIKQNQFDANDKNSIQNLIQNRNKLRGQQNDSRYNSRSINQQSPEFSKTQSPNIRINRQQENIKKFYESKQEQLERLSNTKQSESSSIIRNENLSNSSGNLNKYILPKTTSQNNQKIQGNIGINLSKLNKTQIPQNNNDQSSLQSQFQKRMNNSQISPSKLTQIIVKEKQSNFDDSFANKDYSEFNPTKVQGSQNQISSYSHIKSMIQETQSNLRINQQIETMSQKSKLNSKGRIFSEEKLYSPMNSKLSQTAREYNRFNN
ncbi:endo-1,4-beta-xylanase xylA, putative (macronuclear) [Tetrahymena thermophila SB210]|uniref:Endo-1,4-beta-xylanase xylA, putative n=1 Tax=Tetrahymena thermophila (strain SB210) TaxID=312017 RepID=I7MCU9_TETTS|nr:endo-1,4-beta-xylanase xylA, putative [Tetrahymena thermophila SB210]EAR84969.2 endo-1,4-beta-xylanase xylA, putative [Tetrahymena thermophila SB210]|eukprot:XP_001032632.2 endo-1,4-beta-xylanase xylA, putative [Tetrahymena thermophila SB210]